MALVVVPASKFCWWQQHPTGTSAKKQVLCNRKERTKALLYPGSPLCWKQFCLVLAMWGQARKNLLHMPSFCSELLMPFTQGKWQSCDPHVCPPAPKLCNGAHASGQTCCSPSCTFSRLYWSLCCWICDTCCVTVACRCSFWAFRDSISFFSSSSS